MSEEQGNEVTNERLDRLDQPDIERLGPDVRTMYLRRNAQTLSFSEAQRVLRSLGVNLVRRDTAGDYRVRPLYAKADDSDGATYFTSHLPDAINTGVLMAAHKQQVNVAMRDLEANIRGGKFPTYVMGKARPLLIDYRSFLGRPIPILEWAEHEAEGSRRIETTREVVYLRQNGTEFDREKADQYLVTGRIYTTTHIQVERSHSYIWLQGLYDIAFNLVMFGEWHGSKDSASASAPTNDNAKWDEGTKPWEHELPSAAQCVVDLVRTNYTDELSRRAIARAIGL